MKRFLRAAALVACCLTILPQTGYCAASPSATPFQLVASDSNAGLTEYRLKSNGLTVLLAERHASPVVTVMVVYRVGSRNEAVGYTGSTHFLEHMMFKGTTKHDPRKGTGIDDVLKQVGGINNATTFYDRTNYYEIVPAANLDMCLELEADRMRNALLREEDRTSEMTVVRNELEQGENFAASVLDTQVFATAFREHPYHHPVIGWRSDVEGVPIQRLRQFYNDFYYPNNATLLVIGDFKSSSALEMIARNFGKVPASPKPFPKVYTTEPPQQGERRFVVQRGQEMPKVLMGYHIPNAVNKDSYSLEVLASILGDQSRQSSRLYKALVDKGLASETSAANYSLRDPGLFCIYASATSGTAPDALEKTIREEVKKLENEKVSDAELTRAKNALWKKMKLRAADPMGMAEQLAEAIAVADWKWWVDLEKNLKAVTADDVQRVAKKYFTNNNTTVGTSIPKEKPVEKTAQDKPADQNSEGEKKPVEKQILGLPTDGDIVEPVFAESDKASLGNKLIASSASLKPSASTGLGAASAAPARFGTSVKRKELPNGLRILAMKIPGTGVVSVAGKVAAGDSCRPLEQTALPDLVSEMADKGTKKFSKEEIAGQLEMYGTNFKLSTGNFWTEFSSNVVREDFDPFLNLVASVMQEPTLAHEELEKAKKVKEAEIQEASADAASVAVNSLLHKLYPPESVYYEPTFESQLKELPRISHEDLKKFHKRYYNPANTVISVVGDIEPAEAFAAVEKAFGGWEKGERTLLVEGCGKLPHETGKIISPLSDKSSIEIVIGRPIDMSMKSPDFYAFQIANSALGHDTISSRLAVVRETHGLTYGINSSLLDNSRPFSPWTIQYSVNPENLKKASGLVDKIIAGYLKSGISAEELATEKKRLAGEYLVVRTRTSKSIAETLSRYEMIGVPPSFMDTYPASLAKVSAAEANAVIRKYMNIKDAVTSMAGSISAQQDTKGGTKK